MNENGYYPEGAQYDSSAPYNEKELPEKEIEVCVSITLSKSFKIKVDDYTLKEKGVEDGACFEDIDYSTCNLKDKVKSIVLPNEAYKYLTVNTDRAKKAYKDLKDWNIDEFEVVLE